MTKRTNVEMFNEVLAVLNGGLKDEFQAYVDGYVAKAEKTAAHRAEKRAEADAEVIDAIKGVLGSTPKTRDAIFAELLSKGVNKVGNKDLTVQKISTVLSKLEGVTKVAIKDGKVKKMAYTVA